MKLGSEKGSQAIRLMLADARLQSRSKTLANILNKIMLSDRLFVEPM